LRVLLRRASQISRRGGSGGPPRFPDLSPRPWYRRISWTTALPIAASALALGSAAIWFYKDARSVISSHTSTDSSEGTLIVNINTATLE
jgi:hypothetical protein